MQTVDLSKYLTNIESLKKDLSSIGNDQQVPEEKIIKNHLGDSNYRVLLCTFNEPSFQGEYNFQITKERLIEQMDKLVGDQVGELDQRDCRERAKGAQNNAEAHLLMATRNMERSCGNLLSYEIAEDLTTGVIELFGVVRLTEAAVAQLGALPHYFSMRCVGDRVFSRQKPSNFRVVDITAFDIEPVLFN